MRRTWLSPRAIGLHLAVVVTVPGFCYLGWWQLHRALAGNGLSWAYTFEWPFFSCYAIFMWWRLVHDIGADRAEGAPRDDVTTAHADPTATGLDRATRSDGVSEASQSGSSDAELDAYNRYLASLSRGRATKRQ